MKINFLKKFFRIIGPGVITGAADDDPSGIATYSQTGAQFGYNQLWTTLFMLPLQTAVQEACARIGAVTGKGIAAILKEHYNVWIIYTVVFLIIIANTINIGADIGAMAAATQLILPINFILLTMFYSLIIILSTIFFSYKAYATILKWACLALFSYPLTVFMVKCPWWIVLKATFIPHMEFNFKFLFIITGVLGTTISPYLFFWQASEVVEEKHMKKIESNEPKKTARFLKKIRIDNMMGMLFSELIAWSIIVVAATVLNPHGINDIKTAADTAKALEPFVHSFPNAGYLAKLIFAIGIIGSGLIAIPVLAGSAAYAFSEAFKWKSGFNLKLKRAPGFYGAIIIATLIGFLINVIKIDPMKALIYTAVINGVVAVPLIFIIAMIANNKNIMGNNKSGILSYFFVWLTFICMFASAIAMFYTLIKS